jgi:hypothetical protein
MPSKKKVARTVDAVVDKLKARVTRLKKKVKAAEGAALRGVRKGIKRAQRRVRRLKPAPPKVKK